MQLIYLYNVPFEQTKHNLYVVPTFFCINSFEEEVLKKPMPMITNRLCGKYSPLIDNYFLICCLIHNLAQVCDQLMYLGLHVSKFIMTFLFRKYFDSVTNEPRNFVIFCNRYFDFLKSIFSLKTVSLKLHCEN